MATLNASIWTKTASQQLPLASTHHNNKSATLHAHSQAYGREPLIATSPAPANSYGAHKNNKANPKQWTTTITAPITFAVNPGPYNSFEWTDDKAHPMRYHRFSFE